MSNYGKGHLSSTTTSKCLICNKSTSTYAEISNYNEGGTRKLGTSITIPVCDEHYNNIPSDVLVGYASHINKTMRNFVKTIKED